MCVCVCVCGCVCVAEETAMAGVPLLLEPLHRRGAGVPAARKPTLLALLVFAARAEDPACPCVRVSLRTQPGRGFSGANEKMS